VNISFILSDLWGIITALSLASRPDRCPQLLRLQAVSHSRVCIHASKAKVSYAVEKRGTENIKTEGVWL